MSGSILYKTVQDGMVFCFDPSNSKSYVSGTSSALDLKSNTPMTFKNKVYYGGTGDILTDISPTYDTNNCGSIYFNGVTVLTGDALYLPTGDTTTNLTSQVTLSVWFKKTAYPTWVECPVAKGYNPGTQPFTFYLLSGSIYARLTTGTINAYSDISTTYSINVWNNAVLTYDGSTMKLYLNGVLKSSISKTGSIMNSTLPFHIGGQYNGGYYPSSAVSKTSENFKGYLSNVLVYDRGLSSDEVLQNYNALKKRFGL